MLNIQMGFANLGEGVKTGKVQNCLEIHDKEEFLLLGRKYYLHLHHYIKIQHGIVHNYYHIRANSPCFIITVKNLTMTLEQGLNKTCLCPFFSAVAIALRASAKTFIRTMVYLQIYKTLLDIQLIHSNNMFKRFNQ